MHPPVERPLREATIRSRQHVLAPHEPRVTVDPFGNELGMLHHVGRVADDAGDQHLAFRQLHILPYPPLVLVAWIGAFDHIGPDLHLQDEIHDVFEWYVRGVRTRPAPPTDMIAN